MLALRQKYLPPTPPRTLDDVFRSGMPALSRIRRLRGEATARAVLVLIVNDMLDFFNAGNDMNDRQVATTVDLILEEYPYMQPDDITLCFRRAMKGRYGKLYNRIDGQIIMGWLREYNRERCTAADYQSYNQHKARLSEQARPTEGIFYAEYRASLQRRAREGDPEARQRLELSDSLTAELNKRRHDKVRDSLEHYRELRRRAREGDPEAARILNQKHE